METTAQIITDIVNRGTEICRADINAVIESVAGPGEAKEAKKQSVLDLFTQSGQSPHVQGNSVLDTLDDYSSY